MKHSLLLAIALLFISWNGFAQDVQQVSGLEAYVGELKEWGEKKGKLTQAKKGFFLLQINKDVLVLPAQMKDKSKEIVAEFLNSGVASEANSKVITVFGWSIEQGAAFKMGQAKSIVAQAGDNEI